MIKALVFGHDTIECSYYLEASEGCSLNFDQLAVEREKLRLLAKRERTELKIGSLSFLLGANGSNSGYPFILTCPDFTIACGPNNSPSFYVKFHSQALWRESAKIVSLDVV